MYTHTMMKPYIKEVCVAICISYEAWLLRCIQQTYDPRPWSSEVCHWYQCQLTLTLDLDHIVNLFVAHT